MAIPQTPGVLVLDDLAIQTYPANPHDVPHEFLTNQYGCDPDVLYPTAKIAWSSDVPHEADVMTPPVYNWKTFWSASTQTDNGWVTKAVAMATSLLLVTLAYPLFWNLT